MLRLDNDGVLTIGRENDKPRTRETLGLLRHVLQVCVCDVLTKMTVVEVGVLEILVSNWVANAKVLWVKFFCILLNKFFFLYTRG